MARDIGRTDRGLDGIGDEIMRQIARAIPVSMRDHCSRDTGPRVAANKVAEGCSLDKELELLTLRQ